MVSYEDRVEHQEELHDIFVDRGKEEHLDRFVDSAVAVNDQWSEKANAAVQLAALAVQANVETLEALNIKAAAAAALRTAFDERWKLHAAELEALRSGGEIADLALVAVGGHVVSNMVTESLDDLRNDAISEVALTKTLTELRTRIAKRLAIGTDDALERLETAGNAEISSLVEGSVESFSALVGQLNESLDNSNRLMDSLDAVMGRGDTFGDTSAVASYLDAMTAGREIDIVDGYGSEIIDIDDFRILGRSILAVKEAPQLFWSNGGNHFTEIPETKLVNYYQKSSFLEDPGPIRYTDRVWILTWEKAFHTLDSVTLFLFKNGRFHLVNVEVDGSVIGERGERNLGDVTEQGSVFFLKEPNRNAPLPCRALRDCLWLESVDPFSGLVSSLNQDHLDPTSPGLLIPPFFMKTAAATFEEVSDLGAPKYIKVGDSHEPWFGSFNYEWRMSEPSVDDEPIEELLSAILQYDKTEDLLSRTESGLGASLFSFRRELELFDSKMLKAFWVSANSLRVASLVTSITGKLYADSAAATAWTLESPAQQLWLTC